MDAVRIGTLMLACGAGVIMVKSLATLVLFGPVSAAGRHQGPGLVLVNTVLMPAVLFLTALWGRRKGAGHPFVVGVPVSVAVLTLTAATNVLSHDASAGSQVFLVLPVLYAAYFLRPAAAAVVTGWAVVMAIVTVLTVAPEQDSSLFYFGTALVITAVVLTRAQKAAHDAEDELARMASQDALTGLASRWVLDEAAAAALAEPAGAAMALMVVDVDLFKDINDAFGHPGGDAALVGVADHLREHAHDSDIVSRLGGDEFAVLMMGCSRGEAMARGEAVVRGANERGATHGTRFTLSAGLAHAPDDAVEVTQLYVVADRRLYEAKQRGRNRLVGPED